MLLRGSKRVSDRHEVDEKSRFVMSPRHMSPFTRSVHPFFSRQLQTSPSLFRFPDFPHILSKFVNMCSRWSTPTTNGLKFEIKNLSRIGTIWY